jgi:hypothetical protein
VGQWCATLASPCMDWLAGGPEVGAECLKVNDSSFTTLPSTILTDYPVDLVSAKSRAVGGLSMELFRMSISRI